MNLKELLAQTRVDIKERQTQITAKRAELRSAIENAQTPEELDATKAIRSKIEDMEKERKFFTSAALFSVSVHTAADMAIAPENTLP